MKHIPYMGECSLLTTPRCLLGNRYGLSFLLVVFFAVLVVGHMISGTDGGLALVGLFGAAILFVFFWDSPSSSNRKNQPF
jgi:hypothetical protein